MPNLQIPLRKRSISPFISKALYTTQLCIATKNITKNFFIKKHFVILRNIKMNIIEVKTKKKRYDDDLLELTNISKALSHPLRLYILKRLSKMNACCYSGDLVDELGVGRSTLSQHLKELKYAGLIQGEIEAPYIKYCINRENWALAQKLYKELFNL